MNPSKTKNKPVLIVALLTIILGGLFITGISAYFMAVDGATNDTNPGNCKISIKEKFEKPDIEPGETTEITKKVTIQNTGKNNSGIRIRVEFSNSDIKRTTPGDTSKWAIVDYNTDKWTKSGNYWYYNTPLEPDDETEPLFNKIICDHPTNAQVSDFDVYVYAESRNCEEDATLSSIRALFS